MLATSPDPSSGELLPSRTSAKCQTGLHSLQQRNHVSHSLNSLKGRYIGDYIGDYYRAYKGGYRSFDYSSCELWEW